MVEGQEGVTWPQWQAIAAACERHGISTLFRSDHYQPLDADVRSCVLDAWATTCALAATTSRLRLGTLVSPVTFRHPATLAKLVATADNVSGGRIEVGIGAGWHEGEHRAFGFPLPSIATRMDMVAEQLAILRGLWAGEAFTYTGEHYRLVEANSYPRPVQDPLPLIVGGSAGARSAALAASVAAEYNTAFATPQQVRARRDVVERAWTAAGRDAEDLRFSVLTGLAIGRDHDELAARVARLADLRHDPASAPPDCWIHGTVEQATVQLREFAAAGADRVMLQLSLHDELDQIEIVGEDLAAGISAASG